LEELPLQRRDGAQPRLSRILRLKSRRVSFVRCSGRAAAAKAAIRSTARAG
jgi:hypothetical protein